MLRKWRKIRRVEDAAYAATQQAEMMVHEGDLAARRIRKLKTEMAIRAAERKAEEGAQ